jgi:hypothetical protein
MVENDNQHIRLGISRETWLMYRALFINDVLYADALVPYLYEEWG